MISRQIDPLNMQKCSERPKRPKSVSAETEISAKLTETSAEISAEILPKNYVKWVFFFKFFFLRLDLGIQKYKFKLFEAILILQIDFMVI